MDQLATVIGVAVFFGLAFALGDWVLGVAKARTGSRQRPGWRWLTLPIAATLCFAGFLLLRPLIVDQPRTPLWFVIGLVAIALLIAGATALGYAAVAFGSWAIASLRGGQFHGPARTGRRRELERVIRRYSRMRLESAPGVTSQQPRRLRPRRTPGADGGKA